MNSLTLMPLLNIPDINPGDNLVEIIAQSINNNDTKINDGDIFVIAQKIISKSENRYISLNSVKPSKKAISISSKVSKSPEFIELVLMESDSVLSTDNDVLIVEHKLGFININAGIDMSNIKDSKNQVLLLPQDPMKSANILKNELSIILQKDIKIIISDSMTRPHRYGITGFAIGSSGINCLIDKKGTLDMFGNDLLTTEIAAGDELASAASIIMGQGDARKPIILIKGYKESHDHSQGANKLGIRKKDDLYRY